jgi:preprotein translocase SecE subunit
VVHELKKVTWSTKKDLFRYTVIVLITIAFFAIILGFFDFIWLRLIEFMALA